MDTLTVAIDAATKELVMREAAMSHLRGIPAIQNQTSINRLYDELNRLHIARMES